MEQCGKDIWLYILIPRLLKQNHFHDTRPDCAQNTEGIRDYTWLPPFCLQALSIHFQDIGVNLQMTKLLSPGPLDLERKGCFISPLKFQTVMLSFLNLLSDPRNTNFLFFFPLLKLSLCFRFFSKTCLSWVYCLTPDVWLSWSFFSFTV